MKISNVGLETIKNSEGCSLTAYQDIGGTWTIGIGHAGAVDGVSIHAGMNITMDKAYELLANDVAWAESGVNKYASVYQWNQNEYDAMVSFCYNIGNISELTNYGKLEKSRIPEIMMLYNKARVDGVLVEVRGLTNRRNRERELFLTPVIETATENFDVEAAAQAVIRGEYGNGEERKSRLGNQYAAVQSRVNELLSNQQPAVEYFPKYGGASISIVDIMRSYKVSTSFAVRTTVANKNGITNYEGTAEQNLKLVSLAKEGKLIK